MRVAIFPARGGSVRIPRKNVAPFMGKPMIQWPIEAAQASRLFDVLIVSTDDHEIAALARQLGCDVHMRQVDDGTVGTQEIARRVILWLCGPLYEVPAAIPTAATEVAVIYPCSPMLTAADLRDSCAALTRRGRFVASYLNHDDAGCFYWGHAVDFHARLPLQGNTLSIRVDPRRFIDINTPEDWARAESMFKALHP